MLRAVATDSKSSHRRVLTGALLGSVLIHLGLGLLFLHFSKPGAAKRTPPSSTGIEIEVQQAPKAAPIAPAQPPKPKRSEKQRVETGPARGATHQTAKIARGGEAVPEQSQIQGDVPRQLDLTLHGPIETASPGGTTTRNLPGQMEEVRKSVAQSRINQWIDDDSASRRVEKGLVDDWFAGLHRSLDRALKAAPVPAGFSVQGSLLSTYAASAAQYGATGNPGEPSGHGGPAAPSFDHQGSLGGALGSPGTFRQQLDSSAMDPWAVVELSYDLAGKLRGSKVLESSGNRQFNLHVLRVVSLGLPGLPELPDGGEGIRADGTRSVWRIRGHLGFQHDPKTLSANDIWYLPLATAVDVATGFNLDDVAGQLTGKPQLQCQVELLQVY
jgi:outer membrane biosynthesis protein TonB